MRIPLIVSLSSSGEPFNIDLVSAPHLFISYTEKEQLTIAFKDCCHQLKNQIDKNNISANKVVIKYDPYITAKDAGLPAGSITPVDGSLHVDATYSGVSNGNKANAENGAIIK